MSGGPDPTPSLFGGDEPGRPHEGPRARADAARGHAGAPGPAEAQPARNEARAPVRARRPAAAADTGGHSPMMRQYLQAKKEVGDALLFFRMGDFYELFLEDAEVAARELDITLTSRSKSGDAIPMAGVPVKAYEAYLHELLRRGFRVAVCEQVEDPRQAKGLVERRVTRIVTAGTVVEDDLLERGASNYLLAIAPGPEVCGLAWLDVSTGAFHVADVPAERLADEVSRLDPAEILLPETAARPDAPLVATLRRVTHAPCTPGPEWTFEPRNARELVHEQLGVTTLEGFGVDAGARAVHAAGAALRYVHDSHRGAPPPISSLRPYDPSCSAALDRATRACLEILTTQREGRRDGTLLARLDATSSPMGARLLREWLVAPLVDPEAIGRRQSAVAELVERRGVHDAVGDALAGMPDLERIATRLLAQRGSPRDMAGLRAGLRLVPALRDALTGCHSGPLGDAAADLDPLSELLELLERGLADPPAPALTEGGLIAPGYDDTLDELRALKSDSTSALARFQAREVERTGIGSLKVGFNKVFGYYIEVSHANADKVPDDYTRKQTLTSAERYITPELKEMENRLLGADERAKALETELFLELRARAAGHGETLRALARAIARVDVLAGFTTLARRHGWVRPEVDDSDAIDIRDGRHPVVEASLEPGAFVANDIELDRARARLVLITGPNMAGKSTYIRQVALLVLMAQVGSFVPARRARVGVVDRILTRIGAADDLAGGRSTFMVEMTETANILNNATDRSLVILDEVGRGTSTWDGLALAWAISEYLYTKVGARTLFATHYHELVDLADEFEAVRNVNVAVREWGDEIVFLHKIVPGGTDRSYGVHVARLAGVPPQVVERSRRILVDLEQRAPDLRPGPKDAPAGADTPGPTQHALFPRPVASVVERLSGLDPDEISPLEALLLLRRMHEEVTGREPSEAWALAQDDGDERKRGTAPDPRADPDGDGERTSGGARGDDER